MFYKKTLVHSIQKERNSVMNGIKYLILVFSPLVFFFGCDQKRAEKSPNVILIMADDMGYETLACYGGLSYSTPVLDTLANSGIRFDHCVSQPLCTPSRVKIMTGLYNYRNYGYFGHLDDDQHTFGHLFKQKGYATCIAGKWQLNGLAYPDSISNWNDPSRPQQLGFDEYSLWQLTQTRSKGERYSDPLIEQNGEILSTDIDDYGPDIFCQFILDFMERKYVFKHCRCGAIWHLSDNVFAHYDGIHNRRL